MKSVLLFCTVLVISAFRPEFWDKVSDESFALIAIIWAVAWITDTVRFFEEMSD